MEDIKEKLIEIIGFGIERERAELKADEIIELFKKYISEQTAENTLECGIYDEYSR